MSISGQVAPRKRFVWLVVKRRTGGRLAAHGVRAVRVRRGGFRTSFTPSEPGRHRFSLVSRFDRDTDRGRLGPFDVSVRR